MSCFSLKNNISYKNFYDKLKESYILSNKINFKIDKSPDYLNRDKIGSYYIPNNILNFINSNKGTFYKIDTKILKRQIKIKIIDYKNLSREKINQFIKMILFLIKFLSLYASSTCSNNINITIYLTSFKKLLNNQKILGVNEVNSGYSTCGCYNTTEIVIYRQEEWFKVLIHELFHNLNLDFCDLNIDNSKKYLKKYLNINAKFNIYEAYCETSARFVNVLLFSFLNNFKMVNYNQFKENFKDAFQKEVINSLEKAKLVISLIKNVKNYEEGSNVFDYYVITASLLNNYYYYLKFIKYDFNFIKTDKNIEDFTYLIKNSFNDKFFESLNCVGRNKSNSLKMTITNIF